MEAIRIIRSMDLRNFQSHESTHLDFSRGFNVIVGNSDSGKTSILRALRWVFYNEPRGDFFIQHGKSEVEVRITWDDGTTIRRYRSKRKNGYEIIYPNGETQTFEGFNHTVPEEVTRYLRMWKVSFGPTTFQMLNIADQLEGPFLLSETPRHRAAAIASLTHADEIDEAATLVKRDVDRLQRELKRSQEECSRIEEAFRALVYVDEALLRIQKMEDNLSLVENFLSKKDTLSKIVEELEQFSKHEDILRKEISRCGNPERLKGVLSDAEHLLKKHGSLQQTYEDVTNLQCHRTSVLKGIEDLKNVLKLKEYLGPLEELNRSLSLLMPIQEAVERNQDQQRRIFDQLKVYQSLSKVHEHTSRADRLNAEWVKLKQISAELDDVTSRITLGDLHVTPLQRIGEIPDKVRELERGLGFLKQCREAHQQYKLLSLERDELVETIKNEKNHLVQLQDDYLNILLERGVCPTCLRPIDDIDKANFIKRLKEEFQ